MKSIFFLLTLTSLTVEAQSLLQNGTFDQNINHWSNDFLSAVWVSNDGAPASGNGSLQFGDNSNNNASLWIRSDLVPATEGYRYVMASSYKIPSDSLATGMRMTVFWYDDMENLLGEYPWNEQFNISQPDVWQNFDYAFENIIEGATQARVYLWVHMPGEGTEQSYGLFDDVILFQDTVFMTDFE